MVRGMLVVSDRNAVIFFFFYIFILFFLKGSICRHKKVKTISFFFSLFWFLIQSFWLRKKRKVAAPDGKNPEEKWEKMKKMRGKKQLSFFLSKFSCNCGSKLDHKEKYKKKSLIGKADCGWAFICSSNTVGGRAGAPGGPVSIEAACRTPYGAINPTKLL
jgi:hypothetical protein